MAVVHPLAFALRRILYAVVILYCVEQVAFFSGLLLLATCLIMLVFVTNEEQWESKLINA